MSENAFQIALLLFFFHKSDCLLNIFDQELIATIRIGIGVRRTGCRGHIVTASLSFTSSHDRGGRIDRAVLMLQ